MSFIGEVKQGTVYAPGYFLANGDENVVRETREASAESDLVVTSADGTKHIPMGTAYPTNDGEAIGLLYEDVDVTVGNMPCSVVTGNATVYSDRLAVTGGTAEEPVTITASAQTALEAKGFKFIASAPAVTRPY